MARAKCVDVRPGQRRAATPQRELCFVAGGPRFSNHAQRSGECDEWSTYGRLSYVSRPTMSVSARGRDKSRFRDILDSRHPILVEFGSLVLG